MKLRMTVGRKCLGLTLVASALTITVGLVGYWGISVVAGGTKDMLAEEAQIAQHSARLRANILGMRRYEKDLFLNIADAKKVDEYIGKWSEQQASTKKRIEALAKASVEPADKERVAKIEPQFNGYVAGMGSVIARVKGGQIKAPADGNRAVSEYKDVIHQMEKIATDWATDANERMDRVEGMLSGKARRALWTMISFALGAVVVGVVLSTLVGRSITRPLRGMLGAFKDIAAGDLTRRLDVRSGDEVGEAARALNDFTGEIEKVIAEARGAADQVAAASTQLSAASEQLASGAQEQASSLEETAASLEEITGTVKQTADNARQANQLAIGSRGTAEKGGEVVGAAVASMGEINKASKRIADIITTIDEIAFQTNLLALNAAVEAARAGEQGRGFAVVAAEVRNLAQRSASAAKEIKELIQDSVRKVEAGSELVNRSGTTLGEIVNSVKRVGDLVAEIAAASQEQSTGIDQVGKAVTQMDQVTQANAAQTEELSGTAQSLAAQATHLQGLVAHFKVSTTVSPVTTHLVEPNVMTPAPRPARGGRPEPTPQPALMGAASSNGLGGHDDGFEEF